MERRNRRRPEEEGELLEIDRPIHTAPTATNRAKTVPSVSSRI